MNMSIPELMETARVSPQYADELLTAAIKSVDRHFEDGYAKKHPELLGAFM